MPANSKLPPLEADRHCLAVFDFDGTLTRRDSMFAFMRYAVGLPTLSWALILLAPMLLLNRIGLVANQTAKERLLFELFAGWSAARFEQVAQTFSEKRLNALIRPDARQRLLDHQQAGHQTVVVSASLRSWLVGWCEHYGVDLLASEPELIDQQITGKLQGLNCSGKEKLRRLKAAYELTDFELIYAYGDSSGDKEMLAFADHAAYRVFQG